MESLTEAIRRDYLGGMSVWAVGEKYHWLRKRDIRQALEGIVRPKNFQRTSDPSEEELVARREAVKSQWTAEVASRRWVGRYLTQSEDRGSCLSRLFRDMGGDG